MVTIFLRDTDIITVKHDGVYKLIFHWIFPFFLEYFIKLCTSENIAFSNVMKYRTCVILVFNVFVQLSETIKWKGKQGGRGGEGGRGREGRGGGGGRVQFGTWLILPSPSLPKCHRGGTLRRLIRATCWRGCEAPCLSVSPFCALT